MTPAILDLPAVSSYVALSESTVQKLVRESEFPKPRQLSGRRVGWTIAEPNASNALETELWRSALQQHLSCLLDGQDL